MLPEATLRHQCANWRHRGKTYSCTVRICLEVLHAFLSIFTMTERKEQRAAVKFCFLLGKTAAETVAMLQTAYKDVAMSKTQVYEWFACFKNGQMSLEYQPCSGRPSTSRTDENITKIHELIMEDHHRTIDELVDLIGVSWSSMSTNFEQGIGNEKSCSKNGASLAHGRSKAVTNGCLS